MLLPPHRTSALFLEEEGFGDSRSQVKSSHCLSSMGALAPFTHWTPEDDFILKRAVEAGASLESLAKGAVQFSRRFTFQELQDRWNSLLYDPVVSAEASAYMIDYERTASSIPSKVSRLEHSRASKKRKFESIRNFYYSQCIKFCSDPISSFELSFLVAPDGSNDVGNEGDPLSGDCMHENPVLSYFGFQGPDYDTMHPDLPGNLMDGGLVADNVCITAPQHNTGSQDNIEGNFPTEKKDKHDEFSNTIAENPSFNGNISAHEDCGEPNHLGLENPFEADRLGTIPSKFNGANNDPCSMCSEFDGKQVFNSSMLECNKSYHDFQLSSLRGITTWEMVQDIQEQCIPLNDSLKVEDNDAFNRVKLPAFDVIHPKSKVKIEFPCDNLDSSIGEEKYFPDLSNSLLEFADEILMMDVDENDAPGSSYDDLTSLLLTSPNDGFQDQAPQITEAGTLVAADADHMNPSVSIPTVVENKESCSEGEAVDQELKIQVTSPAPNLEPRFSEMIDGNICCVLNTEDLEIPSNDGFPLPNLLSSAPSSSRFQKLSNLKSSVENHWGAHKTNEGGTPGVSCISSSRVGSPSMTEMDAYNPNVDSSEKGELPNSLVPSLSSRNAVINYECSNSVATGAKTPLLSTYVSSNSTIPFRENSGHDYYGFRNNPNMDASGIKQAQDVPARDHSSMNAKVGLGDVIVTEPEVKPLTPDQAEFHVESDGETPCFSDIEAVILDMDLDPDDQDLYYNEQVSKYQHEDTRRIIMRLEQNACSSVQRDIAKHGAFAMLHSRYSRHYIKKPEVLLGRATEDIIVDIDLSREGHASNKISRRQAIIKMDKVGSFYLKNLGKCSISINNKELHPGHSVDLNSQCLIEIRGIPFIFESNKRRVKQFLDGVAQHS